MNFAAASTRKVNYCYGKTTMKRVLLIGIVVSTFMLVSIGQIVESQLWRVRDKNRYKVHVNVYAADESMIPLIKSYIKRELQLLDDIEIVSQFKADYFLKLVVVDLPDTSNIAIATCYFQRAGIRDFLINPGYKWYDRNSYTSPVLHNLVYHEDILEEACKGIARYYFH